MIPPIEWIYPFLYHSYDWTEGYVIGIFLGAVIMGVSILTSRRFQWVQP